MFGRSGGGLAAYFLIESINGYKFAIAASVLSVLGFGICMLTLLVSPICLFIGTIMIGVSSGLFWVMVPSIVMEDAGELNFGLNWGLTLFLNVLGMLIFGEIFTFLYSYEAGGSQICLGGNCVFIQFATYAILGVVAAVLCYFGLVEDEKKTNERKIFGMKY